MLTRDPDPFAELAARQRAEAEAADARHLDGGEVARLREAIAATQRAIASINTRGLGFYQRRLFDAAVDRLRNAAPLVAARAPAGNERDTG